MTHNATDLHADRLILHRDLMQATLDEMRSTSVRATNRQRTVAVEVDGFGAMTGLSLTESAYDDGPAALADDIVKTAQVAARLAVDRVMFLAAQLSQRLNAADGPPAVGS